MLFVGKPQHPNRLPLNGAVNGLCLMSLNPPIIRNAAQKELTLLEGSLDLAKLTCTGKKFTVGKNATPDTTHVTDAGQGNEI